MEGKVRLTVVLCILLLVIDGIGADDENRVENRRNENNNNVAQYALECSDDSRVPESVVNCELLIAGLKSDAGLNRQELCCALLSSQATKSMCCHQVRELCHSYSTSNCPTARRRIKPPRLTLLNATKRPKAGNSNSQSVIEETADTVPFYKAKNSVISV